MTADPTPPTADLSNEALDALEKDLRRKVTLGTGVVTPLRIQAADAITALRAENEKHRHQATRAIDRWSKSQDLEIAALERATAAEAEVKRLRAEVDKWKSAWADSEEKYDRTYARWMTAEAERDFALADFLRKPGEREALIEALKRIYNMGQSAEPCHWNFRVHARKIAAEAVAAAENGNMKAGTEERSPAMTALAVRDSKMRTKAMREAMGIIAKIERDEMADSDGTPCASAHSDTE